MLSVAAPLNNHQDVKIKVQFIFGDRSKLIERKIVHREIVRVNES